MSNTKPVDTDFRQLVKEIVTQPKQEAAHDLMRRLDAALNEAGELRKKSNALATNAEQSRLDMLQLAERNAFLEERLREANRRSDSLAEQLRSREFTEFL